MKTLLPITVLVTISFFVLDGCSSLLNAEIEKPSAEPEYPVAPIEETSDLQEKILEGAEHLRNTGSMTINGTTFNEDCTGAVLAVYYYAGIDLGSLFSLYTGNGVKRLYNILGDRQLLHTSKIPSPGDIIFWDNTYDRNGDKKWNDELTHTGIVVAVTQSGQIQYVHYNYRKGVVVENMNLTKPDIHTIKRNGRKVIVNSPMRMRQEGVPHPEAWLSGQLFRSFGQGYALN